MADEHPMLSEGDLDRLIVIATGPRVTLVINNLDALDINPEYIVGGTHKLHAAGGQNLDAPLVLLATKWIGANLYDAVVTDFGDWDGGDLEGAEVSLTVESIEVAG